ncbi:S8 family peptidase [Agromyces soli]
MRGDLGSAIVDIDLERTERAPTLEELKSTGVILTLEAASAAFPLKLETLDQYSTHKVKRPKWLLLSVHPAIGPKPERAVIWVSDDYRDKFLALFDDYLAKETSHGQPANRALVANIATIRASTLEDLWQSDGEPARFGTQWWELWLRPPHAGSVALREAGVDALRDYCELYNLKTANRILFLRDRTVVWVQAKWSDLAGLPFTKVPLTEVRRPEFVDTVAELGRDEQAEYATDLASRVTAASPDAPAVCHLDSGVRHTHSLLRNSISESDIHSVVQGVSRDVRGHGTLMAGLALFGPLTDPLLSSGSIELSHRLESVKILPDGQNQNDPQAYGLVTAQAVASPEAVSRRRRVFCMPITAPPESAGEPTLWSASVDALAMGVDVGTSDRGIELIGRPEQSAARLFLVSAGNIDQADFAQAYLDVSDASPVHDPAQSWNALTVGAHTELTTPPTDPSFDGWNVLASNGDLSPHSRTSVSFNQRRWPIKPDICMEGGNVLSNGAGDFHGAHPTLSLLTTDNASDDAIGSANATSAATAQAARIAAKTMSRYPSYWPETVRGLMVHAAEWTPAMRRQFDAQDSRTAKLSMLRRYGWGVPSEDAVLYSSEQAVTMITQDRLIPFVEGSLKSPTLRLHELPWPEEQLRMLADAPVTLRVTLSYFIEPTASRRGWKRRYSYPSHSLRFDLKNGLFESEAQFLARVNREAASEEDDEDQYRGSSQTDRWLVGTNQRNFGSLHQDLWEGTGSELADCGLLAVYPIGGWWKYKKDADRGGIPVRYSLIVSLRTSEQSVDLYSPIQNQIELELPIEVEAT